MREPLIIPGAIFPDCLPSRRYVYCLPGDGVYTDSGRLDLPAGQTLQSCTISEAGHVAGGGQRDDQIWLHDGEWRYVAAGGKFFQAIFDHAGKLWIYYGPSAMGYRYVAEDGSLVLIEDSRIDPESGLYEYVKLPGGITIGLDNAPQGNDSVVIHYQNVKRTLCQGGECRWIRAYREGNQLSVAFARQKPCEARMMWFAVDEIGEFPIWTPPVTSSVPPVVVTPPPVPPVVVTPAPPGTGANPPNPAPEPPKPPVIAPPQPVDRWKLLREALWALIARLVKR